VGGPAAGAAAYYAEGFGGQLVEVVPGLHLVIVVSSYLDDVITPSGATIGSDELQHVVDVIVPIVKTHPTR
jgi:hypothetical protein